MPTDGPDTSADAPPGSGRGAADDPPDDGDAPVRPRLYRSRTDRYLGGVAGGVAERFAIDPAFVRLGLVAATLYLAYAENRGAHPFVLIPYALLWAWLPTDTERAVVLRPRDRDARRELVLIAAAIAVGFMVLDRPSSIVVLALGGLAVVLLRDLPARADGGEPERGSTTAGAVRWTPRGLLPTGSDPWRARPPRQEPPLWPLTLGLLVVIVALAAALDQATEGRVDPRIVVDLALLAVGGILVLSAWRGRARVTLLALALLAPLWVATSVPDIGRFDGHGTLSARPTSFPVTDAGGGGAQAPDLAYELGYGTMDIDLGELPFADGDRVEVHVDLTAGRATVTVPADARVEVAGTIGFGTVSVDAPRHFRSDTDLAVNRRLDRSYPALGTECVERTVPDGHLPGLASSSGVDTDDAAGGPLDTEDIVEAVGAAGYPTPVAVHTERVDPWQPERYDEFGDPIATTSIAGGGPQTVTYWSVHVAPRETGLCKPTPPPSTPATVVVTPTIGLGTLEIHRG